MCFKPTVPFSGIFVSFSWKRANEKFSQHIPKRCSQYFSIHDFPSVSCQFSTVNTSWQPIFLHLSGAAQWDSVTAQWFGGLVWTGLGRPEQRPDPTPSGQGEAQGHVPLSVWLLDHSGQHAEVVVHSDRGTAQEDLCNTHTGSYKHTVMVPKCFNAERKS